MVTAGASSGGADPTSQELVITPNYAVTGSTASAYRPLNLNLTYLATDQVPLNNVYQGNTSTVTVGDATHAAKGTLHTESSRFIVANNGDENCEHAAHFGYMRYDSPATPGRAWFTDWAVHGAVGVQQSLLNGITMLINNHYNGSPSGSASAAQWLVTNPTSGGGINPAHTAATTYPVDVGLGIVGVSSSPGGVGFTTGIQVGGQGSGWPIPASKVGTGILIRDYVTTGLRVKARSGTTGSALVVEAGQGPVGFGVEPVNSATVSVDGGGYTAAIEITGGPLRFLGATSGTNVFTAIATGDTNVRMLMGTDGHIEWGPGTAGRDITATYRPPSADVAGAGATLKVVVPQTTNVGSGLHLVTPNAVTGDSVWLKFNNDRARFGYNGTAARIQIDDGYTTSTKDFALRTGGVDRLTISASTGMFSLAAGQLQVGPTTLGFFATTPTTKRASTADATDLATVLTLANALKADLVAYGLKS
jgi:hypothetical protein